MNNLTQIAEEYLFIVFLESNHVPTTIRVHGSCTEEGKELENHIHKHAKLPNLFQFLRQAWVQMRSLKIPFDKCSLQILGDNILTCLFAFPISNKWQTRSVLSP